MSANLPKQWLDVATEDLTVARLVFEEGHMAHACFFSQQCIEKSLKAYLIAKSNAYPRVHNLVDLLALCQQIAPAFSQFLSDCVRVDQYNVPTRYPAGVAGGAPGGTPSKAAAEKAMTSADTILHFVTQQLPQPSSAP